MAACSLGPRRESTSPAVAFGAVEEEREGGREDLDLEENKYAVKETEKTTVTASLIEEDA